MKKKRYFTSKLVFPAGDWPNKQHKISFPAGYENVESMEVWEVKDGGISSYDISLRNNADTIQDATTKGHYLCSTSVAPADRAKEIFFSAQVDAYVQLHKDAVTATAIELHFVFVVSNSQHNG